MNGPTTVEMSVENRDSDSDLNIMTKEFTYQNIIEAYKMDNILYLAKAVKDKTGRAIMTQIIAEFIKAGDMKEAKLKIEREDKE